MQKSLRRECLLGIRCVIGWVGAGAWAQTVTPPAPAKAKLERLKIAVAPLGWDTNFTWLQSRSGQLDKRPALEYLVGIERNTGQYILTGCEFSVAQELLVLAKGEGNSGIREWCGQKNTEDSVAQHDTTCR